jgi:hypothetical protein
MKSQEDYEMVYLAGLPISRAVADKVNEQNDDMEENKMHLVKSPIPFYGPQIYCYQLLF